MEAELQDMTMDQEEREEHARLRPHLEVEGQTESHAHKQSDGRAGDTQASLLPHLTPAAANQDAAEESGVPALVVTQVEEAPPPMEAPPLPAASAREGAEPPDEMTCSDLLSLLSDSLSLSSETAVSRRSEDDDNRSVTASSVTSLFQRLQLDPVEKLWMRSCALGNIEEQLRLLLQEPGLVLRKDFITTALHWAAKQGRQEVVDVMLRSGADVNVRSGYTALHLAAIHGHAHIVHALIHNYSASSRLRDYHGRTALQYWSGSSDVFTSPSPPPQSGVSLSRGRRTQRYPLTSLLSVRSRSHSHISLEFSAAPPPCEPALDLHV